MFCWSVFVRSLAAPEAGENERDVDVPEGRKNRTTAEEWLRLIFFESFLSTVYVVWADVAVHLITTKLP